MSDSSSTQKLYDLAPYETAFEAKILSLSPAKEKDRLLVVLDQTLFFPEEGGQTPDRGSLAGFPVVDVQIKKDEIIVHTICVDASDKIPSVGDTVHGEIDWAHRFSNMQNHSGEHILSGLLHTIYGYENVGFHLSDNTVTLDTSGHLSDEQIEDLERRANQVIYRNVPITCEYPSKDVLANLDYRSKKEIDGQIRIVTIEGVDVCACCAPHVRKTGEVGSIHITSVLHTKNTMRLTFVCGERALFDVQQKRRQLQLISHMTNLPQERVSEGVQRMQDEILALKERAKNLELQYVEARVTQILAQRQSENENTDNLWIFEPSISNLAQRTLVNKLCEKTASYVGVFVGNDESGYTFIIGSRGGDARTVGTYLKEAVSARGGGKPEMITGSVKEKESVLLNALQQFS